MKTERVPIGSVQFDPANVRRHGEKNLDAIKASLSRFGQQKPIVVDADGIVRAGNGTLMAAKALGWPEVTIVRTALKGAEATAYAIADNRTAELAEWDDDALAQTLAALQIEDEELAKATGFDDADIDAMLAPDEVTEDEVPEPPADPITKPGDLWLLGEHRLLCGDSTKATDVAMLMQNELCKLVVTDPPYGVSYAAKNAFLNAFDKGNSVQTPIENDHLDTADAQKLWKDAFTHMGASMDAGSCVYCFMPQGGDQMMMMMMMMMQGAGIEPRHELIWLKNNHVLGRTDYAYKHEPIMYAWKKGGHKFYGEFQTSILEFARPSSSKLHPTMKPVELICKLIQNSSRQGEILYEPFCGSGTTLIAAEQLGRKCYGMEISPAYCDVIVKRWETLTGKKATRG